MLSLSMINNNIVNMAGGINNHDKENSKNNKNNNYLVYIENTNTYQK